MPRHHKLQTARNSIMKALVIYDNFALAAKANAMLQRATFQVDAITRWNIRPWRVDVLKLPRRADEALREAVDAHLIVFAGPRAQSLPSWLEGWLEQWVVRRQVKDAALAVIDGNSGDALSMPGTPDLSRFARRHGLSFIRDDGSGAGSGAKFPADSVPEAGLPPPLIQPHSMDTSMYNPDQHWGINE